MTVSSTPSGVPSAQSGGSRGRSSLLGIIEDLHRDVARVAFPLDLPESSRLRDLRLRVETQIGGHLLPRLRREDAPAIVVLGGSTGAGKSTIINSVIGEEVSDAGVLRPTTIEPVLAIRPEERALLADHPLTQLARVITDENVPTGLALLDAPDLDSVRDANRSVAGLVLETADLWVFVTTASRYGDAIPWRVLGQARERGITIAVVLNRVPKDILVEVRKDLLGRLDAIGLGSVPLFVIDDLSPHEGLLPDRIIAPFTRWLGLVGGRSTSQGIVRRTNQGVWGTLRDDLLKLAEGLSRQSAAFSGLRTATDRAAEAPVEGLARRLADGRAASGAPTTRWLSVASSGGPLALLTSATERLRRGWRDSARDIRTRAAEAVGTDARAAAGVLIEESALSAAEGIRDVWRDSRFGAAGLLERVPEITNEERSARVSAALAEWTEKVDALAASAVTATASDSKVSRALGREGISGLLQAAALGLEGAQRALRYLFGAPSGSLVDRVRDGLVKVATDQVVGEGEAYRDVLESVSSQIDNGAGLRLRASELKGYV